MSFAENLKQIRNEKRMSQEELAELIGVSRQAVSKWEQGEIYPEVEKLLLLATKMNVSLDRLMATELGGKAETQCEPVTGSIIISSPNENVITTCCKVASSQKMNGGKNAPQYALFGVGTGGNPYWGEPTTFLGWYADRDSLSKEISAIREAIAQGLPMYELQYSARVQRKWMRYSIVDE